MPLSSAVAQSTTSTLRPYVAALREQHSRPVSLRRLGNATLPRSDSTATPSPAADSNASARQVMHDHPTAATLFLGGLARDARSGGSPRELVTALSVHGALIGRVGEKLSTTGEAGLQTLARQVRQRPAHQHMAEVYSRFLSQRVQRDLERSECRGQARQPGPTHGHAEAASPPWSRWIATEFAAPSDRPSCNGLRISTPVQGLAAGLLLAAHLAPAAAQVPPSASEQRGLMGISDIAAGPAPRGMGYRTLLTLAGSAMALTAMAGMTLWRVHGGDVSTDGDASLPGSMAEAAALEALLYLDAHRAGDGDTLLDRLMWHAVAEGEPADSLAGSLMGADWPDLEAMGIDGRAYGAMLGALVELEDAGQADRQPVNALPLRSLRQARSITGPRHPMRPPGPRRDDPCAPCRAIRPLQQALAAVESATALVTDTSSIQQLPAGDRNAYASCLARLERDLNTMKTRLEGRRDMLARSEESIGAIAALRTLTLDRLISRLNLVTYQVFDAVTGLNRLMPDRIG